MSYRVVYAPSFCDDLRDHAMYLRQAHVGDNTIDRWFRDLLDLVDSLNDWPHRYAIDPVQTQSTGTETRKLNFGDYLIFYQIDDERKEVHLVAYIHGARRTRGT